MPTRPGNEPQFPLYVVSKGRYESRLTVKTLERMGVDFFVVIEEQEYPDYSAVIDARKLLVLDPAYQRDYETCDDLGLTKSVGPGPARNFVWDHSIESGAEYHWVMDDNILKFCRLYQNRHIRIDSGAAFRIMEDFATRFETVAMAGPNYFMFVLRKAKIPPFVTNTRIYSCNLIRNDTPYRWRGRYNEDTDLSLRMLKDGWATIQFNAILQYKMPTQTVKGGNTREFYEREGTLPKSEMLVALHPDVTRLVLRFGRPHHHVNYRPFKRNRLRLKKGVEIPEGTNEYGLSLTRIEAEREYV